MLDLSVVVVTYQVRDLLRECLRSALANQGVNFELCVVDNASDDGTADMVRTEFPRVRLIALTKNIGYAAANNAGLRGRDARYLLLLNPDTKLPPDAFVEMVGFMDRHPEAGAAGPKLIRQDGSLDLACRRSFPSPEVSLYRMLGLSTRYPNSRRFGRYNLTYLDPNVVAEVDSVVGAFMLVRQEAIQEVGLLDQTFFMYGEDLDWAYRIKAKGWKIFYNPAVTVLHYKGQSSRKLAARATREFYRAMLLFYRKHYQASTPRLLHCLIVGGVLLQAALAYSRTLALPASRRRVGSA